MFDEERESDDEDDVDESQEGPTFEGTHVEEEPTPPPPPLNPPPTFETGRSSSSTAYMPLDPAFLQSLSILQLETSGFQEGYTSMCDDLHRLSRRMKFFKEGITYFRGFVDRQEEREWRQIQHKEEWAMREA